MNAWTFNDMPDQTSRTAIVTGANTGIGFETARMLALRGANVVLACRNPDKGKVALERLRSTRQARGGGLTMADPTDAATARRADQDDSSGDDACAR